LATLPKTKPWVVGDAPQSFRANHSTYENTDRHLRIHPKIIIKFYGISDWDFYRYIHLKVDKE
jgi:hypothetical protein